MDNRTPPITGTTATTPAQPSAPFDPDTLPPHLRVALDRLSEIRYDALVLIAQAEAEANAAEAADAAKAAEADAAEADGATQVALDDGATQVALDDGANQDSIIQGEGDTTNEPCERTGQPAAHHAHSHARTAVRAVRS